jgi:regulatory LuxR family protein
VLFRGSCAGERRVRPAGIVEATAPDLTCPKGSVYDSISPETVKTHLEHVFGKLALERRAQAIARAKDLALLAI